jgi:hypothetical protein
MQGRSVTHGRGADVKPAVGGGGTSTTGRYQSLLFHDAENLAADSVVAGGLALLEKLHAVNNHRCLSC